MFTGIIEGVGRIVNIRNSSGRELFILGGNIARVLKAGESISVNGVCLTVTEIRRDIFKVFLSKETISRTNLGKARIGNKVNLERAISFGDRMGGHIVTGHVDAMGTIYKTRRFSHGMEMEVEVPRKDRRLIVPKGSIALDGVSLSIASVRDNIIKVVIIPHTINMTTLGIKKVGEELNLEYDIIGKYVWEFYQREKGEV